MTRVTDVSRRLDGPRSSKTANAAPTRRRVEAVRARLAARRRFAR